MATEKICPGPFVFGYETVAQDDDEDPGKRKQIYSDIYNRNDLLDIGNLKNLAITTSYFNSGFASKFIDTPVTYYLIAQKNATATQMSALKGLCDLPWTLKVIFGMISDGVPINGYRRKPWFFVGWVGFVFTNYMLYLAGNPEIETTIFMCVVAVIACALADVCQDTLCVERGGLETDSSRGMLQTTVYTVKAFGAVLGAMLGAIVYNKEIWGWGLDISSVFLVQAAFPLLTITFIWSLVELTQGHPVPDFSAQLLNMWSTLKLRAGILTLFKKNLLTIRSFSKWVFLQFGSL
jgi:hypothetical protein